MTLLFRRLSILAYRSVKGFFEDQCTQRAAAISYYVLFSLFPLVIFSVGILGLILQDEQIQTDIADAIMDVIPLSQEEGRNDVLSALESAMSSRSGAIGVVGLVTLAWSGSAMFGVVRSSLNQVFRVATPRPPVLQKLLDLAIVLAFAPLFIGSIVVTSALRLARATIEGFGFAGDLPAWWVLTILVPIAMSFVAFFLTYWLIPAKRTHAKYVVGGALLAALLFEAVKLGFAVYLENFASYDVIFGSLGAVVAFLFWVFLSANILLLGAEVVSETPRVMAGSFDVKQPSSGPKRTLQEKILRLLRGLIIHPRDDDDPRGTGEKDDPVSAKSRGGESGGR